MAKRHVAVLLGLAACGAMAVCAAPGIAAAAPEAVAADSFAQGIKQTTKQKTRTKIRVYRGYPYRTYHSAYPLPYEVEYPGPNGVRHCINRYVTERRPSGNVIVPQMRCTWVVRR